MRTNIRGGGGSSPPFATSRAHMTKNTSTVIADGATSGIAFNGLGLDPSDSTDYSLVPDNGDGTVGLQVNKGGLYIYEYRMNQLIPNSGTIQVIIDLANTYGYPSLTGFTITPTQNVDTDGIYKLGYYYTDLEQGVDSFGVFVINNSGASITIPLLSIHFYMLRVAPSPSP